jgi:coenzyme F420-reducing hydrogenase gamma subunit
MVVSATPARLRLGIVKFASCDGCQLSLLDLEDELLQIAGAVEIAYFLEATSVDLEGVGPFDVTLVEGSISTADQAAEIIELREQARLLVTIGACANAGGIQALRNWASEQAFRAAVYPSPEYVDSLATATPISEHVTVDASLPGCPISGGQLREVLASIAIGRRPQIREESVCVECKRRGTPCILVSSGIACLGPVTQAGCGAICPAFGRGCYACFGPKEAANTVSLGGTFVSAGRDPAEVGRLFAGFTAYAEPFRTQVTERGGLERSAPFGRPSVLPVGAVPAVVEAMRGKGSGPGPADPPRTGGTRARRRAGDHDARP